MITQNSAKLKALKISRFILFWCGRISIILLNLFKIINILLCSAGSVYKGFYCVVGGVKMRVYSLVAFIYWKFYILCIGIGCEGKNILLLSLEESIANELENYYWANNNFEIFKIAIRLETINMVNEKIQLIKKELLK